jgi:ABC-type sugar transport system, periplasmic component
MKRSLAIILSIILSIAIILPSSAFSTITLKSIKLDKTNLALKVGQTYQLKVTLTPANTTQKLLSYATGNNKVATVDKTGKITAIGAGSTLITVYSSNKKLSAKCKVTVTKPTPITLKWVGAGWLANEKADTLISRYEKANPNIKIKYTELSNLVDENYLKNLDIMIASGEQIDLTYLGTTDTLVRALNGAALPINDAIKKNGDDFVADYTQLATSMLTVDGKIYGVPYANNTFKVFYNKTMAKEKGITIPAKWSYQQFTEVAKKFNDPEKKIWGCIFPSTWSDLCYAPAEVSGWVMAKKDASGKYVPNFDDKIFRTSMQWAHDIALVDKVSPSYATIKAESLNRRIALATGKAGMIIDGPYTLVFLQNYMYNDPGAGPLKFELGVTEMPYITEQGGNNASFLSLVGSFWFPKTSKNVYEAYRFSRFICNGNFDKGVYMPAYTKADMKAATKTLTEYTDKFGTLHQGIYRYETALAAVSVPNQSYISYWKNDPTLYAKYVPGLYKLFTEQYSTYMSGEVTLDQFVKNMQELGEVEISKAN